MGLQRSEKLFILLGSFFAFLVAFSFASSFNPDQCESIIGIFVQLGAVPYRVFASLFGIKVTARFT